MNDSAPEMKNNTALGFLQQTSTKKMLTGLLEDNKKNLMQFMKNFLHLNYSSDKYFKTRILPQVKNYVS